MDFNIAIILYFASKGEGNLYTNSAEPIPIKSNSKIVLSGSGADEIFGGLNLFKTNFAYYL